VKGCVVPSGIVGIAGVTAIETSTAGLTVMVVEPLSDPELALTLVLPTATLVAIPGALIVAILPSTVLQLANAVRSSVLPSL
jgi:hypothetical protein